MTADLLIRYRILARLIDDPAELERTACARRVRREMLAEEWPRLLVYPLPGDEQRPTRA